VGAAFAVPAAINAATSTMMDRFFIKWICRIGIGIDRGIGLKTGQVEFTQQSYLSGLFF
jgi:hypothetical protein